MLGRILLALGGLVVAVLFIALLAPFFIDWSSFRLGFEEQASRIVGRKVSVHGEVEARLLPFPSVTLHDVRVGPDLDGKPLAEVARFSMDMELAPFLSGEARIFDMRVEEPKVRVRLLKDGTLDWMRGSRGAALARNVILENVSIIRGEIQLVDEQTGRIRQITGLSAALSAQSLSGPWRGEGNATLDGYEARFSFVSGAADTGSGRMPLRLRLWPDVQPVEVTLDGELAIGGGKASYNGIFAFQMLEEEDETEPVTAPAPGPRLKGSFELTNERIRIPQYRLEAGPPGDPYVVTGEATLDTGSRPEFLLTADGQQIDVNKFGPPKGKMGRDASASAQRRIRSFIDMAASIPIPQVPGRASLRLPAIILNDTTVRDIKLDLRPAGRGWTVDNAVATLPGRTQLEAKGNLVLLDRVSFVGDMLLASTQPSGLADWLVGQVAPEIRQLRTAGFSSRVNLTPEFQRFDRLELAIGPAILKGNAERQSQAGQPSSLSASLSGNEIDIDVMRALASLMTGDDAGKDFLDHRISASLTADRFTALGMTAANVDTAFALAGGVLSLERLSIGNVGGASISARGRLEGSLLSYAGQGSVKFRAAEPSNFLALLKDRLPPHPLLQRLATNASFFTDTDLSADLHVGGEGKGVTVSLKGKSNGSTIDAQVDLPGLFDLTRETGLKISAAAENPRADVLLGQAGFDPLPFGGVGQGRLSVSLEQEAGKPAQTELAFNTPSTSLDMSGEFEPSGDHFGRGQGRVAVRSGDIEPYLLMNGIGLPQFGAGLPLELNASLEITEDAFSLRDLKGAAETNRFSGDIRLDRTKPGLPASGSVSLSSLDLAWLGEAVFGPVTDPMSGGFSTMPLAGPIFGRLEADLKIKADVFHAGDLGDVRDFSADLSHRAGGVTIENASGIWHGGKLGGRLMISNADGVGLLQARLAVDKADLSSLAWKAGERPVAAGRADLKLSAEATGRSVRELLAAASGSAELRLMDLAIAGLNTDALKPIMAQADRLGGNDITEARLKPVIADILRRGDTVVGTVTVPVTITRGEARVQPVSADTGKARITGDGRFNLIDETMNANLDITYDASEEAMAGDDATLRLNYAGDLTRPAEGLDVSALVNFLSQRAFEQERRRVEALQASVLEKQRLRREVSLYNFLAAERQAAREKAEAEERARQQAAEVERRRQAEAAAARAADQQRQPAPFIMPPSDDTRRLDGPIAPLTDPVPSLPGVQ